MGRPSNAHQRKTEILDAFEACVTRFGVEGSTLERIAEEAGLARALIRHHVGNKEELTRALVERVLAAAYEDSKRLFEALPAKQPASTLIDWLFDARYTNTHQTNVMWALISAATYNKAMAQDLGEWTKDFINRVQNTLHAEYPNQSIDNIKTVATGVVGIYFNIDSLASFEYMSSMRHYSKQAALALVYSLTGDK